MGKHKKHGKSSSSSSSSSSSDDEYKHLPKHERKRMKKLKKQMRKGQIPPGSVPGMYPGGAHGAQPHGMPHGAHPHGMPHGGQGAPPYGGHGAPPGPYPSQPGYPAAGGYPTGVAPPPGSYPSGPQPGGMYPGGPPGGAYPQAPNPAYPSQPGYPAQPGYPGAPPPAGGFPGGFAPTTEGESQPSSSDAGGFGPPPGAGVTTGPDFTQPNPYGGAPPAQPGYPQQPGGIPPQPGYPQAGGQQPGYPQPGGMPPQQPGYPQPGGAPPAQPGYAPGQQPPQPGPPGGMPPGQMPPGGVSGAASQFQRMGLQGTADVPRPTVVPAQNFNAEADAGVIRKAMKGMGTDEQAIVGIISTRSNQQRQEIMKMFKTMYGKDLIKELESELSGDFREAIMALFKATTYYDAWSLHQAMSGPGTKDAVLIEILCTRTNAEIRDINSCYQQFYHRSLEKDIISDTSGYFKRLLVSCCQANRAELTPDQLQRVQYEGPECVVDRTLARNDAQQLYQAGEGKMGTDESVFLQVMAIRHYYQMRATFEEYVKVAGRDILSSIDREMSGDLKEGMKALVMSAKNRPEYFADRLDDAMRGAGTKDSTLIRVIVSRSEMDLQDIKEVYLFKYHKTVATAVRSDTGGDYKRLLLALVGQ